MILPEIIAEHLGSVSVRGQLARLQAGLRLEEFCR